MKGPTVYEGKHKGHSIHSTCEVTYEKATFGAEASNKHGKTMYRIVGKTSRDDAVKWLVIALGIIAIIIYLV